MQGSVTRGDQTIDKGLLLHRGISLPVFAFGGSSKESQEPVVIVSDRGKEAFLDVVIDTFAKANRRVFMVDLRGYGETTPGKFEPEKNRTGFGVTFKESFLGLHLNRPLLGERVGDLMACLGDLRKGGEVELLGDGSAALVALHAAALDDRVKAVTLVRSIPSWDHVVRTPVTSDQLTSAVAGALKVYDLPDLMASLAPRPLTIKNPINAAGDPLSADDAAEAFKAVKAAYEKAGAADKLTIITGAK